MVERHQTLRTYVQFIQAFCRTRKLGVLIVLTHKGLHHADSRRVLLNAEVQTVVLFEHLGEETCHAADDEVQRDGEYRQRRHEDEAQPGIDNQAHQHRQHQPEGCPDRHAEYLLESILQIADIGGHACHQS